MFNIHHCCINYLDWLDHLQDNFKLEEVQKDTIFTMKLALGIEQLSKLRALQPWLFNFMGSRLRWTT